MVTKKLYTTLTVLYISISCLFFFNFFQKIIYRFFELNKRCRLIFYPWQKDIVILFFKQTKPFVYNFFKATAHFVALYGFAKLFAYRKPNFRHVVFVLAKNYYKVFVAKCFAVFIHVIKLVVFAKPILFFHHLPLCRKLVSAFCSSSSENVSATFACHSFTEAVYFAALSFFRLISSFHFAFSYFFREFPIIFVLTNRV